MLWSSLLEIALNVIYSVTVGSLQACYLWGLIQWYYILVYVLLVHLVIGSLALYYVDIMQYIGGFCIYWKNNHYNSYEYFCACFCKNISFHFCRVVGPGTLLHPSSHAVWSMVSFILFAAITGMQIQTKRAMFYIFFSQWERFIP